MLGSYTMTDAILEAAKSARPLRVMETMA
jgi:hypothetical protein